MVSFSERTDSLFSYWPAWSAHSCLLLKLHCVRCVCPLPSTPEEPPPEPPERNWGTWSPWVVPCVCRGPSLPPSNTASSPPEPCMSLLQDRSPTGHWSVAIKMLRAAHLLIELEAIFVENWCALPWMDKSASGGLTTYYIGTDIECVYSSAFTGNIST